MTRRKPRPGRAKTGKTRRERKRANERRRPREGRLDVAELRVRPGPPVAERDLPRVSVIILNLNGRHHLQGCFDSLAALAYPEDRLEVILIDNGSDDGSVEEMRARHSWVKLVTNAHNAGFSQGCNQGANVAAAAEVLVFLNNDMRVEPDWLRELVAPIVRGECSATTAKMLSWDGKLINSAGGGMNFHGIGIQVGYLEEPGPEHDVPQKTLFACGGAMATTKDVFHDVGGFDPEFFAYYEDVDLGWRMWVMGHEVHYVPSAVCYHHHSSTSRTLPLETVRLLQIRNPMLACVKNYGDAELVRVLPAMLGLATRRMYLVSGITDDTPFRIEHARPSKPGLLSRIFGAARVQGARHDLGAQVPIRRVAAADLVGINDLLGRWDHWMGRRQEVQSRRQRADDEIFDLFLKPLWSIEEEPAYRALQDGLTRLTGVQKLFRGRTVLGHEPNK